MKKYKKVLTAAFLMALLLCLSSQTAFAFSESDAQAQVDAAGREAVSGNVLVWFLCAIAFLKVSQKIDSFMSSLGVNVGHVLGEELTACGTIPDLSRRLSVIRSRNISMSCVFQNLAGLQNRYPLNLWQEILGNCDVQLFLGCTDPLTAEFVSSRTGLASVAVSSKSKQLGTWRISNYTPEYRETSGVGKRPVLTPDEVLRLPIDEALVIIRGKKTLKVDKMDYSKHPEYPLLRSCKASAHIPEWRRLEMEAAAAPEPAVKPAPQKTDAKQTSKAAVKPATKTGAKPAAKRTVKAPASGAQQKAPSPPTSGSKKSAPSGTPAGIVSADKDSIMS